MAKAKQKTRTKTATRPKATAPKATKKINQADKPTVDPVYTRAMKGKVPSASKLVNLVRCAKEKCGDVHEMRQRKMHNGSTSECPKCGNETYSEHEVQSKLADVKPNPVDVIHSIVAKRETPAMEQRADGPLMERRGPSPMMTLAGQNGIVTSRTPGGSDAPIPVIAPGSRVLVEWPPGPPKRGVLAGYTPKGKPMVNIARVNRAGAYTGELGDKPRTFEPHEVRIADSVTLVVAKETSIGTPPHDSVWKEGIPNRIAPDATVVAPPPVLVQPTLAGATLNEALRDTPILPGETEADHAKRVRSSLRNGVYTSVPPRGYPSSPAGEAAARAEHGDGDGTIPKPKKPRAPRKPKNVVEPAPYAGMANTFPAPVAREIDGETNPLVIEMDRQRIALGQVAVGARVQLVRMIGSHAADVGTVREQVNVNGVDRALVKWDSDSCDQYVDIDKLEAVPAVPVKPNPPADAAKYDGPHETLRMRDIRLAREAREGRGSVAASVAAVEAIHIEREDAEALSVDDDAPPWEEEE